MPLIMPLECNSTQYCTLEKLQDYYFHQDYEKIPSDFLLMPEALHREAHEACRRLHQQGQQPQRLAPAQASQKGGRLEALQIPKEELILALMYDSAPPIEEMPWKSKTYTHDPWYGVEWRYWAEEVVEAALSRFQLVHGVLGLDDNAKKREVIVETTERLYEFCTVHDFGNNGLLEDWRSGLEAADALQV